MHLFPDRFFLHDQLTMTIVEKLLLFLNFFILTQLLIEQTLTGVHHHLAGCQRRKYHELSGKCVHGLCGDRSELALPPLRASTWMSVECEENVFYHTAAPPSIGADVQLWWKCDRCRHAQSWTSIKMGIRSERQHRSSTFSSRPSRCLIITWPPISLSPLIDCSYFDFFHANQILHTLFFFKAHFGATAAWFEQFSARQCLQHLTFKDNMFSFCYSANITRALRKNSLLWHYGGITLGCDTQIYRVTFTITIYELFNQKWCI